MSKEKTTMPININKTLSGDMGKSLNLKVPTPGKTPTQPKGNTGSSGSSNAGDKK